MSAMEKDLDVVAMEGAVQMGSTREQEYIDDDIVDYNRIES